MMKYTLILKRFFYLTLIVFFALLHNLTFAEGNPVSTVDSLDKSLVNWYNADPVISGVQGAAVEKAYREILFDKTASKKVVVAVIDGGVDIQHEDLAGKIWNNHDEIPDNGLDDDNNGYVDDMHGWNFIGNSKGENITYENLEYVRIYKKYNRIFADIDPAGLNDDEKANYEYYLKSKQQFEDNLAKYTEEMENITSFEKVFYITDSIIRDFLGKEEYDITELMSIASDVDHVNKAKGFLLSIYSNGFTMESLEKLKEHNQKYLDKHLNLTLNPRQIIGDDPEDISDTNYGNNNVRGPRAEHGTFVAGIIAANRDDSTGINGIADQVEIMVLRTVPDGDEYDKDVALSIRYAVDNGANIINMSFGKDFSPQKTFVDEAIQYAEENNVLLVHAAGNEADNVDKNTHYPTKHINKDLQVNNWITVGANAQTADKNLPGVFSNYGRKEVDLFAPGVDLVSLHPGSKYHIASGTSFSCPVVSGVAALVWSHYPELTAIELKNIILESTTQYGRQRVYKPNKKAPGKRKTRFFKLSQTGGVVNAYEALKLAELKTKQEVVQK